jgi:hemolysin activation/secretion protein
LSAELMLLPDFMDGHHYLSLFVDSGNAWDRDAYSLTDFSSIGENALSAAGVGIGDADLDWRINIARSLDGRDTWETTFRFHLNF